MNATDTNDSEASSSPWRRMVFTALLVSFLLLAAYYSSYALIGREMMDYGAVGVPGGAGWEETALELCFRAWQPLRDWEEARRRGRVRKNLSGVWAVAADDAGLPSLEVRLDGDGGGWIRSGHFSFVEVEGTWNTYETGAATLEADLTDADPSKGGATLTLEGDELTIQWYADMNSSSGPGMFEWVRVIRLVSTFRRAREGAAAEGAASQAAGQP